MENNIENKVDLKNKIINFYNFNKKKYSFYRLLY